MDHEWKRIGICLTKLQDESCRQFLHAMAQQAGEHHARLLVFNSFLDFFYGNDYETGASSVYRLIDFQQLDALIIRDDCFHDKKLILGLIAEAHKHNVPVIVLYGSYDGCFSIRSEYDDVFEQLICHVLTEHNPKKLRYIAGTKGKAHTEKRLQLFRQVMKRFDRPIDDHMIVYCDDWPDPVIATINAWAAADDVPDTLICANDVMAAAACDQLARHGYRVPEDVVVTGFDGLPSMMLHTPQLTTCGPDVDGAASEIYRMIERVLAGETGPYDAAEHYAFSLSESCGCKDTVSSGYRAEAERSFQQMTEAYHHEDYLYTWADRLMIDDEQGLNRQTIQRVLLHNSTLFLNSDPDIRTRAMSNPPSAPFSEQMYAVSPGKPDEDSHASSFVPLDQVIRRMEATAEEGELIIFQSVYVGKSTCGCYAVRVKDIQAMAHKIYRLCRIMNLAFSVIDSRLHHAHTIERLMLVQAGDSLTGLMNLHGLSQHVNDHYEDLSRKNIAVSVYVIYRYQKMLEDYGLECMEQMVMSVAEALRKANPAPSLIARISESDFVVINLADSTEEISSVINSATQSFFSQIEALNSSHPDRQAAEVHCGCVLSRPDWENNLMSFIKAANGEMYLNQMKQSMSAAHEESAPQVDASQMLEVLLKQNLFHYFFQPIVDAHTGEICAYEALMRTLEPINMMPMQVLDIAARERRLYDIERATLFNVLEFVDAHRELFDSKRVYINTIPGHFLNEEDRRELTNRYSHLFSNCTIEITEMSNTDDAELMQIRRLEGDGSTCQLAIDDYGTGFSNIVNLLRYQPQVIKIDRYLISNVHRDSNKQLFIRSTVEFAKMNGILVLAEGVETREELSKVIELGVDLVQGYYLARPSDVVIPSIPEKIQHFIIEETLRFSRFGSDRKVYRARNGEQLDLLRLAVEKYTSIQTDGGKYKLVGKRGHTIDMPISVAADADCHLILEDVCISANAPAITLSDNSRVTLEVRGENRFEQEGIRIPQSASLHMIGAGSMDISSIQKKGTVLGGGPDESFGKICIDMDGKLRVQAESETSICIGGGFKDYDEPIELLRGALTFEAKGIHTVAVGCVDGTASVVVGPDAQIKMKVVGNEAVGIGALSGTVNAISQGTLDMAVEGERIACVGILNSGSGTVAISGPESRFSMLGANAVCIGSISGAVDVDCRAENISIYMEGARACGLGNRTGDGATRISGGVVSCKILSGGPLSMMPGTVISGGNILLSGDGTSVYAVSPNGEILMPLVVTDQDEFDEEIITALGEYRYHASRSGEKQLCVYVPADFMKKYMLR